MTNRPRIRRRTVRLVISNPSNPGDTVPPRRTNPHGWRFANEARLEHGASEAWRMLAMRLAGYRVGAIAEAFGTTRTAVYQRLYRMRQGSRKDAEVLPWTSMSYNTGEENGSLDTALAI
jgi:hypothetical protein